MFGWIALAILLITIASVVIWSCKYEKRSGKKVPWDWLLLFVIAGGILVAAVGCFNQMNELSPSESGFWIFLIFGVLLILAVIQLVLMVDDYTDLKKRREEFWKIRAEYEKLKKQEEEKDRLEEELRERKYRRKRPEE